MVEPITVTVARNVEPGRESDFEEWAAGILNEASKWPGFLGAGLLKPGPGDHEWHLVYRFRDNASLSRWETSDVRATWLSEADRFMTERARTRVSGLETWFELPGKTSKAPPKPKMATIAFAAIFPIALFFALVSPLEPLPIPLVLRVALQTLAITGLMTWVFMPRLTRLFQRWLYPKS
jgi:uncharacterized protein